MSLYFQIKVVLYNVHYFLIEGNLALRTFARKFSNIDFFLRILPLKDDELVMSEMQKKKWGVNDFVF